MFQLQFQNKQFSTLEDFEQEVDSGNGFLDDAIHFCRNWLEGKQTFEQSTSGSTGKPKIIQLNRAQMQASAKATGDFFQVNFKTKLCCCLNPAYIAGKMMLVRAMEWNCQVILIEPTSDPLTELSDEKIPDFIAMVPIQVQQSLHNPNSKSKLKKVKHLIIGGAPLSYQLIEEMRLNKIHAFQTYGMTETVSHIALAKINDGELIYKILPGIEIGTDDRNTLWIKSPMSRNKKIQTNDQVKLISPSEFYWLGRLDFVVNSGGVKLHPELLERRIEKEVSTQFPGSRFILTGIPDAKFGEKLVLLIESTQQDEKKATVLLDKLKGKLATFEIPKAIHFTGKFQETESGKIDRKASSSIL